MILNELISNALKYAFPGEREGEVVVSMSAYGDQEMMLAVEDDGVGLPAGFAIENTRSLGLRIVQILARQLHGRLNLEAKNGTRFEVIFPLHENGADGH